MPEETNTAVQDFLKNIQTALKHLVTLEIITAVGDVTEFDVMKKTEDDNDKVLKDEEFKSQLMAHVDKVALTRVHLIQGDITTVYHDAYITDENYKPMREYHDSQRDKGLEIVENNLKAVGDFIDLLNRNK